MTEERHEIFHRYVVMPKDNVSSHTESAQGLLCFLLYTTSKDAKTSQENENASTKDRQFIEKREGGNG
jgi:hypothetical protein